MSCCTPRASPKWSITIPAISPSASARVARLRNCRAMVGERRPVLRRRSARCRSAAPSADCWRRACHGPLRHGYGGLRDYCIGVRFVTGDGRKAKGGGRVVKNVAGYDLMKLLIGSQGTLAIITGASFKLFPAPRQTRTFVAEFRQLRPRRFEFRDRGAALAADRRFAWNWFRPRRDELLRPEMAGRSGVVDLRSRRRKRRRAGALSHGAGSSGVARSGRRRRSRICGGRWQIFRTSPPSGIRDLVADLVDACRCATCSRSSNELRRVAEANGFDASLPSAESELVICWQRCGQRRRRSLAGEFRQRGFGIAQPLAARCQHGGAPLSRRRRGITSAPGGPTPTDLESMRAVKHGARSQRHSESREVSLLSFDDSSCGKASSRTSRRARSRRGSCTRSACTAGCAWTSARPIARWARRWIRRAAASIRWCRWTQGRLALGDSFVTHIDRCLGCLNCQTACPSGVPYGSLLERARSQIEENYQRPWLQRKAARHISTARCCRRSASLARHARSWCASISARACKAWRARSGLLKLLGVAELDALSPRIDSDFSFRRSGHDVYPAEGTQRGRVALLIGCIGSVAFAELNRATIRVLTKNGIEVHIPDRVRVVAARCTLHAGYLELARAQARQQHRRHAQPGVRRHRDQRRRLRLDHEGICGAAGARSDVCGAGAASSSAKVRDITRISGAGRPGRAEAQAEGARHLSGSVPPGARAGRTQARPAVAESHRRGTGRVPRADSCCGSAGVYNVVQNEISMKILDEKMDYVASVEPEIIATANVGCMLQLAAGAKRKGLNAEWCTWWSCWTGVLRPCPIQTCRARGTPDSFRRYPPLKRWAIIFRLAERAGSCGLGGRLKPYVS